MTDSRLLRSCSIKSMTMYTLLVLEELEGPSQLRRNSLSQSLPNNYFPNVHNMLVSASHERVYLPQSGDWKPVFFFFEFQFLERDDISGLCIASTEDNPIRALFDLIQSLVGEHGASWENGRVARPRWDTHAMQLVCGGCRTRPWRWCGQGGGGGFAVRNS